MSQLRLFGSKRRQRLPLFLAAPSLLAALAGCADGEQPPAQAREGRAITALTPELEAVVSANDHLAFSLYKQLAAPSSNLFFSPFSVDAALSMTSLGAGGETETEMRAVLGIPESTDDYHEAFGALLADLTGAHRGRGYQLYLANRLFGQEGMPFTASFMNVTSSFYHAPLQTVDYRVDPEGARKEVNGWVSDNTQGIIQELIPLGAFDTDTRLTLANAIYFQSSWASAFDVKNTQNAPFLLEDGTEKPVPLMHSSGLFRTASDELFSMLSLDYADEELSMLLVLPVQRGALAQAEPMLDEQRWRALSSSLTEQKVAVSLPRFEARSELSLKDALAALGMPSAFGSGADFSGLLEPGIGREPLHIEHVLHQSYVRVDEAGTTAAAASAVVVATRSASPEFRVDQPFVFAIQDKLTGALLFLGRIADPS
jgi:serpin B